MKILELKTPQSEYQPATNNFYKLDEKETINTLILSLSSSPPKKKKTKNIYA